MLKPQGSDSMNALNVQETVIKRFTQIMNLPPQKLKLDADLVAEYGLNSLKALKLLSEVEVEFDIDIDQEDAREMRTLNDVIGLIEERMA
jgi:acyl carrier protein